MATNPADLALRNLQRLIERDPLLRDIVNPSLPDAKRSAKFSPDVDVIESEDGWLLVLDLPGVPKQGLKLSVEGSRLTVSGTKPPRPAGRAKIAERAVGPFKREFLLPFQVSPTGIKASFDNGVLEITVPRAGEATGQDIPIE